MSNLSKELAVLAAVIALIVLALLFLGAPSRQTLKTTPTLPPPSQPTAQDLQKLSESPAFQYLVSYTDTGFQPQKVTISKGQTIRFANNSSDELWVASFGTTSTKIYPGTSSCGSTEFDSCGPISHGDYWEFTFQQPGAWQFQNNVDKNHSGIIVVQ
ncbi:MAG: hypothetical protein P4L81_01850 [Candidatus Pacebacteria bacterium]|nr:hypothetical protein [Candidatus Paceibacterota bacterium]